ncbi:hypothetical protein HPB51_020766 [Rhipicephalus microplus]|uniref:Uncharacterized protein n=1 Tax=Rhipicephalus microplus TaxID=6941 RepID=A0A9J6DQ81_RHIMP|nr:hypothetical protein HPB51_020766 [Rhipicephalus microplus]
MRARVEAEHSSSRARLRHSVGVAVAGRVREWKILSRGLRAGTSSSATPGSAGDVALSAGGEEASRPATRVAGLLSTADAAVSGVRRTAESWQILIAARRNYNAVSGLGGKCSWRLIRPEGNRSWGARQRRSSERQAAAADPAGALSLARQKGAEGAVARAAPFCPPSTYNRRAAVGRRHSRALRLDRV